MDNIFEFTKHNILWLHMAEYYTIEKLVHKVKYEDKFILNNIRREKICYVANVFNDYNRSGDGVCYACSACENCEDCPINIGRCGRDDSLYTQYADNILEYAYKHNKKAKEKAHKIALQIANAPKNKNTDIEYIWR